MALTDSSRDLASFRGGPRPSRRPMPILPRPCRCWTVDGPAITAHPAARPPLKDFRLCSGQGRQPRLGALQDCLSPDGDIAATEP